MKIKSIELFAKQLAKEISERPSFDVSEIVTLIEVRVNDAMLSFVSEHAIHLEKEYQSLLKEQSQYRVGSPKYVQTGYLLAAAKSKKALANRASNNISNDNKFWLLKKFVESKYGKESVSDFIDSLSDVVVQKSSSHEIINPIYESK